MTSLQATIFIAAFSIFSKILGAVRQAVLAHKFGAGIEVDIYVAAFRVPDLIFNLFILGTLSVAFIPVFVEYLNKNRQEALKIASSIFNITLLLMSVLAILGAVLARGIVHLIVPGFSAEAMGQTITLTRILMLSPLLFSLSSVLTSMLQGSRRFIFPAIVPLFYNLSIIAGILFFYPRIGLPGLAWGAVLGAFLHLVLQLPSSLHLGLKPFANWSWGHPGVKKIAKLFLPRIIGLDLGQISLLIASVIGSSLGAGSLAVFYFGYDLQTVPLGIFAISFAIVALPTMSDFVARKDLDGFKKFFAKNTVQILFLIVPISVLLLLLRAQVVRLIYGAGQGTAFTFEDTRLVAHALGFFVLSLFAQSLIPLLARSFYALQNTVIPVISGLIATIVNIILAIVLARGGSADILPLAFSIASILNMLILFIILRKRVGDLEDDYLAERILKIGIASIIMGVATYLSLYAVAPFVDMQTYRGVLVQTILASIVAVASYLIVGLIIHLPETRDLLTVLKSWFSKFARPVTTAIVDMFTDMR